MASPLAALSALLTDTNFTPQPAATSASAPIPRLAPPPAKAGQLDLFADIPPPPGWQPAAGADTGDIPPPPGWQPESKGALATVGEYGKEIGKGLASGAIGTAGTALSGVAAADPSMAAGMALDPYRADLARVPTMSAEEIAQLRARIDAETSPVTKSTLQSTVSDLIEGTVKPEDLPTVLAKPTPLAEKTFSKAGSLVKDISESPMLAAGKGWEDSITRTLSTGLGSLGAGVLASILGGPAVSGTMFVSSGAGESLQRAQEFDAKEKKAGRAGLTDSQMMAAAVAGIAPGSTDIVPVEALMGRLKIPQPFRAPLARAVSRIGGQAFIEGIQEGGQEFLQNLIAREAYDPKQSLTEGVLPSAAAGAGIGGIAQAAVELFTKGRGHGANRTERTDATPPGEPPVTAEKVAADLQGMPGQTSVTVNGEAAPVRNAPPPAAEELGQKPSPAITSAAKSTPEEISLLKAANWSDEDIADMDPAEIADAVEEAKRAGVTAPTSAFKVEVDDAPSAEPIGDLLAQARDLADETSGRGGVYLSAANLRRAGSVPEVDADELMNAGIWLDDFDGQGGTLIAKDQATAEKALADKAAGRPMQEIIGELTGAGSGKPADASMVVQQVDKNGAVTRESAINADQLEATRKALERPGYEVRVVETPEVLARREREIAKETAPPAQDLGAIFDDELANIPPPPGYEAEPVAQINGGTRAEPIEVSTPEDVIRAGSVVKEPTEAQKEAGNYQKGHVKLHGLDIAIENPKGSTRSGKTKDGTEWSVKMPATYGYVKRTEGQDGDAIDVYIGDNPQSQRVFVIDQVDPETGKGDEHKAILGTFSRREAQSIYDAAFSDGSGPKRRAAVKGMLVDEFKEWLKAPPAVADRAPKKETPDAKPVAERSEPARDRADGGPDRQPVPARRGTPDETDGANGRRPVSGSRPDEGVAPESAPVDEARKPKAAKVAKPKKIKEPPSLLRFLAGGKGIRLTKENGEPAVGADDLRSIGVSEKTMVPFVGKLIRPDGMLPDYAREAAAEAGYLDQDSTVGDLVDLIARELGGDKAYSREDASQLADWQAQRGIQKAEVDDERQRAKAVSAVDAMIEENEIGHDADAEYHARAVNLVMDGMDPAEAWETAVREAYDEEATPAEADRFDAIPGWTDEEIAEAQSRDVAEGGERDGSDGEGEPSPRGPPVEAGGRSEAGREDQGQADGEVEVASEKGADGKDQMVIPGAEKIGDGQLAQRKADQGLKANAPQKPADIGLFGDEKDQTDLLDLVRKPAPKAEAADADQPVDANKQIEKAPIAPDLVWDDQMKAQALDDLEAADPAWKNAMDTDAKGVFTNSVRKLDQGVNRGDYTLDDVAKDFSRTREMIRAKHGDVVTLYRADAPKGMHRAGTRSVYMADAGIAPEFAEAYAPGGDMHTKDEPREMLAYRVPVDDIIAVYSGKKWYREFIVRLPTGGLTGGEARPLGKSRAQKKAEAKSAKPAADLGAIFDDAVSELDQEEETDQQKAERIAAMNARKVEKAERIRDYLAQGGKLTLRTARVVYNLAGADSVKVGKDGLYIRRGKESVFLFEDQLDALLKQVTTAPRNTAISAKKPADDSLMFDDAFRARIEAETERRYGGEYEYPKAVNFRAGAISFTKGKPRDTGDSPYPAEWLEGYDYASVSAPPRKALEAGKNAAINVAKGLDEVTAGLAALFGADKNRLGSGPSFDEETYRKALPLFKAGVAHFAEAGRDIGDMVRALVQHLANVAKLPVETIRAMKPYVLRFAEDVRDGKETLDAPSISRPLESGGGDAAAQDRVGEADLPAAGGRYGPDAGDGVGSTPEAGRRPDGGRGADQGGAAPVGERGNLEIPRDPAEPRVSDAPSGDDQRSPRHGREGLFPEFDPAEETRHAAEANASLERRIKAQREAERIPVAWADKANVEATLPMLFPEQQDDVYRTEKRFQKGMGELAHLNRPNDGHGMLLTNGTGTGKTFSGLGVAKRFAKEGKTNILIVAPSQDILADWVKSGKLLDLGIGVLESTTDNGRGITATTYANLGANLTLADRQWDLVIGDEAHKLTQGQDGEPTAALETFRAITGHPRGIHKRAQMVFRREFEAYKRESDKGKAANYEKLRQLHEAFEAKAKPAREEWLKAPRQTKALFMSATPFAYHFSLDYAEGYLFNYPEDKNKGGYNTAEGRNAFYVQHFGYRMKTNKLTKPDAEVNSEVMEREFHEYLRREGSLWGRALEVDKDYDRKFVLVHDAIGGEIDRAMKFLMEEQDGKFRPFWDMVSKQFDYLARMRLLEAIKARGAVSYIKQQMELGRKIVVFHDYNEGGGFNPFDLTFAPDSKITTYDPVRKMQVERLAKPIWDEFLAANPYVSKLAFDSYLPPIAELTKEFPDALVYNGTVPQKKRTEAKRLFNTDGPAGRNLIIVQSAAGEAGISLHDTTGKHQRVVLNLGMPARPTTAIQEEGRIYRVGQQSDALFRYMNTGTNWERWTFAQRIAERSGTAENLALGNLARSLRMSFVDAFNDSDDYAPAPGEGKGGKAADRANSTAISEFERAKTHYFGQQKNRKRRDQREGVDYFATPEPLGLKMVEWANLKPGERVLEPSAGHGAIARYLPEGTHRTIVEPSSELASRAALVSPGARAVVDRFENLHITNKYDAIVMNPPFGHGGKTAIDHVEKAMSHLANGGRIVALIPTGQATERLGRLMDSPAAKGIYLVADIQLPAVTFERAGTAIRAQIVVLEKQTDKEVAPKLQQKSRDYTSAETIKEFFDRIENVDLPARLEPKTKDVAAPEEGTTININGAEFTLGQSQGTFFARLDNQVGASRFRQIATIADSISGGARSKKGFGFLTAEARADFLNKVREAPEIATSPKPAAAGGVLFTQAETTHAKLGHKLFVATIAERVERDVYDRVNAVAKKHGGYYSAYRGAGAIPGFQFKTEAERAAFIAEANGQMPPTPPGGGFSQGFSGDYKVSVRDDFRPNPGQSLGLQAQGYVVEKGRATNSEYLVAIDDNGDVLATIAGSESAVGLTLELEQAVRDRDRSIVIHHNHPKGRSLSSVDYGMLASRGLSGVWAHGNNGHSYYARLTPEAAAILRKGNTPVFDASNRRALYSLADAAGNHIFGHIQKAVLAKRVMVDQAQIAHADIVGWILHRSGLIDYISTMKAETDRFLADFAVDEDVVSGLTLQQSIDRAVATIRREVFRDPRNPGQITAIPDGGRAVPLRHTGDVGVSLDPDRSLADRNPTPRRDDLHRPQNNFVQEKNGQLRLLEGETDYGSGRSVPGYSQEEIARWNEMARLNPGSPVESQREADYWNAVSNTEEFAEAFDLPDDTVTATELDRMRRFMREAFEADQAKMVALRNDLRAIASRVAGQTIDVNFQDIIDLRALATEGLSQEYLDAADAAADAAGVPRSTTAAGYWQGGVDGVSMIVIALRDPLAQDHHTTLFHELFHHFQFKLSTEQERKLLAAEMPRLRRLAGLELGYDAAAMAEMLDSEVTAIAFQRYARLRHEGEVAAGYHIGIRRLFDRLLEILAQVRRYLHRRGIRQMDDLYSALYEGQMAARPAARDILDTPESTQAMATQPPRVPPAPLQVAQRQLTPGRARAMRQLARVNDVPFTDRMRVKLQDRELMIRRMEEEIERDQGIRLPDNLSTYMAAGLFPGRAGEQMADLKRDVTDPLIRAMQQANVSQKELDDFLYARHHWERKAEMMRINPGIDMSLPENEFFGSGMSDAEARGIIGRVRRAGLLATYENLAARVDQMLQDARERLVRSGNLSRKEADDWAAKYPHYVPLRGFEGEPNEDHPAHGRGMQSRGPESMAAMGRRSRADSPLLYSIMQAEASIVRSEKNRVAKTFLRFVQTFPDPERWRVTRGEMKQRINRATGLVESYWSPPAFSRAENLLAVKIGGKTTWVEIFDPLIARAMTKAGMVDHYGPILSRAMRATRLYSQMLTSWNPEFSLYSNPIRDIQTALINVSDIQNKPAGVRRKIVRDALSVKSIRGVLAALRDYEGRTIIGTRRAADQTIIGTQRTQQALRMAPWFDEYRHAGGKISWYALDDIDHIRQKIHRSLNSGRVREGVRAFGKLVDDLNTSVENGVRLSTFIALRENGVSASRAAFIARELTVNFNRKGELGPVINTAYMFFNASVQGLVRVAQATSRSKVVRGALASIFAAGFTLPWINLLLAGDDDDGENMFEKLIKTQPYLFERNMVVMFPGDKSGRYLTLPMPWIYNLPFFAGHQTFVALNGIEKPAQAALRTAAAVVDALNPIGGATGSLLQMASPTVLDPFVQVAENRTWFGGQVQPVKFDKNKPDSENYFKSVPDWAKALARTLNGWTGGDIGSPGYIDVSPETLQHFAEFAAGGLGKFMLNAYSTGAGILRGEEWLPERTPFIRRAYGKETSSSRRAGFYNEWDEIDAAAYQVKALRKAAKDEGAANRPDEADRLMNEAATVEKAKRAEIDLWKTFDNARKQLADLADRRRAFEKGNLPDRVAQLDALDEQERQIIRTAMIALRDRRRAVGEK